MHVLRVFGTKIKAACGCWHGSVSLLYRVFVLSHGEQGWARGSSSIWRLRQRIVFRRFEPTGCHSAACDFEGALNGVKLDVVDFIGF